MVMAPRPRSSRRPEFLARIFGQNTVQLASFRQASEGAGARLRMMPLEQVHEQQELAPPDSAAAAAAAEERVRAEVAGRLAGAVETLRLAGEHLANEARSDALEVGFLVAKRILEMELKTGPEPLVAIVAATIRRLGEARKVQVRLNPADAEVVSALLASRGPSAVSSIATAQIEVIPDGALGRGDCVVEADEGSVDGRIATRLEELRRALADEPGSEEGGS